MVFVFLWRQTLFTLGTHSRSPLGEPERKGPANFPQAPPSGGQDAVISLGRDVAQLLFSPFISVLTCDA